jgi:DNA-binding protein H-NS
VVKKRGGKARYRSADGKEWSGFGPKPAWLKAAIEAGKTAEDFRI